jgi:hypothetical protein
VGQGIVETEVERVEVGRIREQRDKGFGCGRVDTEEPDMVEVGGWYGLEELEESVVRE